MPHALLEAMGSGIPVVSTAVGGILAFLTTEEHGQRVPAGDRDALATAISIDDDPARAARLVAGGGQAAAGLTVERMVAEVEQVYATVFAARARQGK